MPEISDVTIVGYGVMGAGIADDFSRAGITTTVISRRADELISTPQALTFQRSLPDQAPDLLIECLPEDFDLKRRLFAEAAARYQNKTILASNTSGLALQDLAPGRSVPFLGIHYCYPPNVIPLVEIIRLPDTADETVEAVRHTIVRTGKIPLVLNEPVLGGIVNRLQHAMYREAYALIDRDVVSAHDIDLAAKRVLGPRMAVTGLIEQKDISGLANHAVSQAQLLPTLSQSTNVAAALRAKTNSGDTGLRSGVGFYDWRGQNPRHVASKVEAQLKRVLAAQDGAPVFWSEAGGD